MATDGTLASTHLDSATPEVLRFTRKKLGCLAQFVIGVLAIVHRDKWHMEPEGIKEMFIGKFSQSFLKKLENIFLNGHLLDVLPALIAVSQHLLCQPMDEGQHHFRTSTFTELRQELGCL